MLWLRNENELKNSLIRKINHRTCSILLCWQLTIFRTPSTKKIFIGTFTSLFTSSSPVSIWHLYYSHVPSAVSTQVANMQTNFLPGAPLRPQTELRGRQPEWREKQNRAPAGCHLFNLSSDREVNFLPTRRLLWRILHKTLVVSKKRIIKPWVL